MGFKADFDPYHQKQFYDLINKKKKFERKLSILAITLNGLIEIATDILTENIYICFVNVTEKGVLCAI